MAKQSKLSEGFISLKNSTGKIIGSIKTDISKRRQPQTLDGTDIQLASRQKVEHHNKHDLMNEEIYYSAIMDNGNTVLVSPEFPEYSLEVMPGTYSPEHNFLNETKHWRMYYINGQGIDKYSAPIPDSYSYLQEMDPEESNRFPNIPGDKFGNRWAIGYNKKYKVLLVSSDALSLNNH